MGGVEPPLMVACWKALAEFLLSIIQLLFLPFKVETLQGKMCQNSLPSGGLGHLEPKFEGKGRPPANILTPLERQLIALQPCRFYIMELCSRLFVVHCRSRPNYDTAMHFDPHFEEVRGGVCLLYTSPSPRDRTRSRMPSSA